MKKAYVFDSSTLILLAKATLLRGFAGLNDLIITPKVSSEVFEKERAEDTRLIKELLDNCIIKENKSKAAKRDFDADFGLGEGEAEALSLALEKNCVLATDDWRAIKACKVLDVRFVTAIHCLVALYSRRVLDQRLALEKLKSLEKYGRYSAQIMKDARKTIEGEKNG